jgi:hypothetical protein
MSGRQTNFEENFIIQPQKTMKYEAPTPNIENPA